MWLTHRSYGRLRGLLSQARSSWVSSSPVVQANTVSTQNRGRGRGRGDHQGSTGRGRGTLSDSRGGGGVRPGVASEKGRGGGRRGGHRGERAGPAGNRGGDRGRAGREETRRREVFLPNVLAQPDSRLDDLDLVIHPVKDLQVRQEMPLRSSFGTLGRSYLVRANFFPINFISGRTLYEYKVEIKPRDVKLGSRKARIFDLLDSSPQCAPYRDFIAHDHCAKIISAKKLPQPLSIPVKYFDEFEEAPRDDTSVYVVEIEFTGAINTKALTSYLKSQKQEYPIERVISALNLVVQKYASVRGVRVGKDKYIFPTSEVVNLQPGLLDAHRGFFVSIRPTYDQLMVNVNPTTAALYAPGNLGAAMLRLQQTGGNIDDFVGGLHVVTSHCGYPRKYTVRRVMNTTARTTRFYHDESKRQVTVEEYFRMKYPDYHLKHADNLPVIDVTRKDGTPEYLPAEVCKILPLQPYRGTLDKASTQAMLKVACNPPATNARLIVNQGLPQLKLVGENKTLRNFSMAVSNEMAVVPSRVLPPPQVTYKSSQARIELASWNLIGAKYHQPASLTDWAVLIIRDGRHEEMRCGSDEVKAFLDVFVSKLCEGGVKVASQPNVLETPVLPFCHSNEQPRDQLQAKALHIIARTLEPLCAPKRKTPQFVLVILPNTDNFIYPGLKKLCDSNLGLQTVCVGLPNARPEDKRNPGTLDKGKQQQYFANVGMKVNVKLGGVNHMLAQSYMKWLKKKRTMLVGIDVTHPSPESVPGTPSIAAVVGSVDDKFVHYPAILKLQTNRRIEKNAQEMVQGLTQTMKTRLDRYKAANKGLLPERIIVYRDGVSETQFKQVLDQELPQMKDAFAAFSDHHPTLSIIVCGKRHHTRFYGTSEDQVTSNGNTPPGTVIDKGITDVYNHDFYLQAHHGLQGTVRPTHYTVVYDENNLDANTIQDEIHKASYTYARATKAVSLVPPAYYADLACERGRLYLDPLMREASASSKREKGKKDVDERMRVCEEAQRLWGNGVHRDLEETMFYI